MVLEREKKEEESEKQKSHTWVKKGGMKNKKERNLSWK